MKTQQDKIRAICNVIIETVTEAGDQGVPSGHIYMALNMAGMNLDTYYQFIEALVKLKKLKQKGDLLYAVPQKEEA